MTWKNEPYPGSVWKKRALYADGQKVAPGETRRVIDRTLGGDVEYRSGRKWYTTLVSHSKWSEWVGADKKYPARCLERGKKYQ